MTSTLFTAPDAWKGGYYEMALLFDPRTREAEALGVLWSFPKLDGPFSSQFVEPSEQLIAAIEGDIRLNGALSLPGGARVACASFIYRHDDQIEVDLSISVGSLSSAWPEVGSSPFVSAEEAAAWEPRLEEALVEVARHVHSRTPFLRGLIDFEGIGFTDELSRPGPIPEERKVGIIEVVGADLQWWPPTVRGGTWTKPRARIGGT
jgi:hypothetical protein